MTGLAPMVVEQPWSSADQATWTYELARAISILRAAHYTHCHHGDWSEACPVFVAWDKRRAHPDTPIAMSR